jgi:hypothetical protein
MRDFALQFKNCHLWSIASSKRIFTIQLQVSGKVVLGSVLKFLERFERKKKTHEAQFTQAASRKIRQPIARSTSN